jgi:hypothetical protein
VTCGVLLHFSQVHPNGYATVRTDLLGMQANKWQAGTELSSLASSRLLSPHPSVSIMKPLQFVTAQVHCAGPILQSPIVMASHLPAFWSSQIQRHLHEWLQACRRNHGPQIKQSRTGCQPQRGTGGQPRC